MWQKMAYQGNAKTKQDSKIKVQNCFAKFIYHYFNVFIIFIKNFNHSIFNGYLWSACAEAFLYSMCHFPSSQKLNSTPRFKFQDQLHNYLLNFRTILTSSSFSHQNYMTSFMNDPPEVSLVWATSFIRKAKQSK